MSVSGPRARRTAAKDFFAAAAVPGALVLALLLSAWVMLVLPGVIVYTVTWGERAEATVQRCEQRELRYDARYLDCRGTWRFADGSRGSGHVSGVGEADIGHAVPVRVGPFGPYAGSLDRSRHALLPGALMWAVALLVAGVVVFFLLKGRARARRLLARLGEGAGTSLRGRRRWRDARGRTVLRFRVSSRPPEALAGAGDAARDADPVRRTGARRAFAAAHVPAGGVAFFIARRAGGFAVLDPGGRLTVVVRRVGHAEPRLRLLVPDGAPLGEIAPYPGTEDHPGAAFRVTTGTGETAAVVVAEFLRWTVVFPGEPPEPLRHAVMAFAFDALRLTR
ncbi:hypothetical protein HUT06_40825 [Actinomadura sp. NAK00032]|uniref:hypothetical protein n=1 Tax=Actinomadura sp. NAK00032 TaxID=2742128 RepID=UPI001591021C|nr:hypothetical protein [Actinomadura sp. NAK00032]QKW39593.1 hypothetical protein HUT06_40825 [Actinomadura sp. NAK00032]